MTQVFSTEWFEKHQNKLLVLLNIPVIGRELRSALSIPSDLPIIRINPSFYTTLNPDGSLTSDFRTHAKFAKRIYHQGYYLWKLIHEWDRLVANPLVPALNLGFDTLTRFPDANPETTSVDGVVARGGADEAWATLIAGAGNAANDSTTENVCVAISASATTNQFSELERAIFLFDTSSLSAGASISSATLSLTGGVSKSNSLGASPDIDIYTSTPASNTALVSADFSQLGTTSQTGSPIPYATWSGSSTYNDFAFNSTGLGNISKTGVSKFGARNASYDVANVAPTWVSGASSVLRTDYADQTGTSNDPKLVVNYILSITGAPTFAPTVMHYVRSWRQ